MSHDTVMVKKVLIAGASGFIGKALLHSLLQDESITVIALSRYERQSLHPRLQWKKCDLYSLKELTLCMESCDSAYYLVHSMLPSAALSQGKFYDFDLLLADNFKRAIQICGVKKLIYLGGLIPENTQNLSWHLKSRLEVEETLKESGINAIMLRAGLIIGQQGSSFLILKRLVGRLPFMVLPFWTETKMEPIALPDVIKILIRSLNDQNIKNETYDIGGKEQVTYRELILKTAKIMGKSPLTFSFNLIPLSLSRLWVSLITQSPRSLVYPLVMSLKHTLLVNEARAWPWAKEDITTSLTHSLNEAISHLPASNQITNQLKIIDQKREVRSVQRLPLPKNKNAEWVSQEYFSWLPRFFRPLIQVKQTNQILIFRFFFLPLLKLKKSEERSTPERQLLYIVGGLLAEPNQKGRLEFRAVMHDQYILSAIHDFKPSLPWFIYKITQAKIHLWVMNAFARHLRKGC